jgi:hypothetical protein
MAAKATIAPSRGKKIVKTSAERNSRTPMSAIVNIFPVSQPPLNSETPKSPK